MLYIAAAECELFAKVMFSLKQLYLAVPLEEYYRLSAELRNCSRIVSLPCYASTIRGYSAPRLVIADEASYCADDLFTAIRPMLAVSEGKLCLLSTPAGRGYEFYRVWTSAGDDWEKTKSLASSARGYRVRSWTASERRWGRCCSARNSRARLSTPIRASFRQNSLRPVCTAALGRFRHDPNATDARDFPDRPH